MNCFRLSRLEALDHICHFSQSQSRNEHFGNKYLNETIFDRIQELAPTLSDSLSYCSWKAQRVECTDLFKPILTEHGLCFTFNALNSHEIYTEEYVLE